MRLHRNAKTPPHMRALLVHRIGQEGWEPSQAADAAGISVRTAYKWLAWYRTGGATALTMVEWRNRSHHSEALRTSRRSGAQSKIC